MMGKFNLNRIMIFILLAFFGSNGLAFGGTEPIWKVGFEETVNWFQVAPTGHLLVSTDEGLVGIDPENGQILWKRDEYKGIWQAKEEGFGHWLEEFVPFTPYAIIMKFSGAKKRIKSSTHPYYFTLLNAITGEEIWSTESMGIKSDYGHILVPEIDGVLLYVKDKNKKKTMLLASITTGNVIWENQNFFKKSNPEMFALEMLELDDYKKTKKKRISENSDEKIDFTKKSIVGNQPPLFDTDETMITFMNKKAMRKWNAKTGELIWETELKAKEAPAFVYGYAPILLSENSDVVYAAVDKKVFALRAENGELIWKKAPKLKGGVSWMQLTPQGLVVGHRFFPDSHLGDPFITVLNVATGKPLWKKEFTKLKDGTNFVIKDDLILVCANKRLYAINIADGTDIEVAKDLKFKEKEVPEYMEVRDDGYFLQSSNNLMLISQNGEMVFHTYYKALGLSFLEKMAATHISHYMMSKGWEVEMEGMHGSRFDKDSISEFIWEKRFKNSKNRETYTYVLTRIITETEKSVGLVKVNKIDGQEEGQLILGTRTPVYELDEYESRLFLKAGDKIIVCHTF